MIDEATIAGAEIQHAEINRDQSAEVESPERLPHDIPLRIFNKA
jgi:hypothetical protein